MSVPLPSAAKILPPEKITRASPCFLALKLTVNNFPEEPLKGLGVPPAKVMIPPLEDVGSTVQSENIEPDLDRDVTARRSCEKFKVASAALIGDPPE